LLIIENLQKAKTAEKQVGNAQECNCQCAPDFRASWDATVVNEKLIDKGFFFRRAHFFETIIKPLTILLS